MINPQTVDGLLEQAYSLIQLGEPEKAVAIGNQLLEHKHARGFEIIALAYEQDGRSSDAIAILREGVAKVPSAWPLWELLGNLFSDQEEYDEAASAYARALSCPNADRDSILYNQAILLKREGRFDDAIRLVGDIANDELKHKIRVLRASLLNSVNRFEEATQMAGIVIQELTSQESLPEEDMQDLARAYSEIGRACWKGKQDRQLAWEQAWKALEWDRSDNSALWLVREIVNRKSINSKWFKLIVEGLWHFQLEQEKPPPGFITTYEVVADSPQDALMFAQDLEPVEVRQSMRIEQVEELGAFPDDHQGVYWRSPYGFYY